MSFGATRREALARVMRFDAAADALLHRFFRAHRAIGRRDRAAIAEAVFDVLRNLRLYGHLAQAAAGGDLRATRDASSAASDAPAADARPATPEALLEISDARREGRLEVPVLPFAIRYSLPDWLADAFLEQFGADFAASLAASLLEPAPLDLRVNALKADVARVRALLARAGIEADSLPQAPLALRVRGKPSLERGEAFASGSFEVQDLGSQLLALLVGARRGQTVIDLCAGAGGKSLAMAAAMRSTGRIYACDVSPQRLQRMRERLLRAGAENVHPLVLDDERDSKLERLHERADAVLIDAPCSGTGTIRRNPALKWRTAPRALEGLLARQRALLGAAAPLVRRGGCLVYATCSLLHAENDAQAAWFESTNAGWTRADAGEVLAAQGARVAAEASAGGLLRLLPNRDESDGFFAVRWQRTA